MNAAQDHIHPFLLEQLDLRGAIVSLDDCWRSLLGKRGYPAPVLHLLGEMSAVTLLIAANLKQPGRMTFQLRGEGPVNLLVLDCDEQLRLRGMARWNPEGMAEDLSAAELLGQGQLGLTLDAAAMRQPYQSLVPLHGDSVATMFEHYLGLSEQQPARLLLAADEQRAVGLLLQKLPGADQRDADGWNRIQHLLATVDRTELLRQAPLDLLGRVFHEEVLRVYPPRPVSHHCPEDWEKIHNMLRGLGRKECDGILREHGEILVRDDICEREYRLGPEAVAALFEPPSPTLH